MRTGLFGDSPRELARQGIRVLGLRLREAFRQ